MKELTELLMRLQQAQRELICAAAKTAMMPSDGTLRRISDLENSIAAVEAVLEDERAKLRQHQSACARG